MALKALTITLAVAAGTLMAGAASAAPLSAATSVVPPSNLEQVRMVCNENGRCWRESRERRVIIREDRGDRRRYMGRYDRDDRDDRGVGIRVPGVSVGIGTGTGRY